MTVTQAASGSSGPYLGRVSGVAGTPNMRTGTYSIAMRVRWGTSATNLDMFLAILGIQSDGRGLYLQRRSGDAGTVVVAYRYDGFLTFNTANITGAYGSTSAWVHIGVTYDGTTIRTYVDGVASGTVASASTLIASGTADFIGCGGPFTGDMADVVMFSRALSAADMLTLANQRQPMQRLGDCFGWYPMIETSSLSNAGLDFSGTGNHCTLQSSGANNPAASSVSVPELWAPRAPLILLRQGPLAIDGSGNVSVSASGAVSEAAALTGNGQSSVSASAAISVATALTGAGQSSVSASAAGKEAVAFTGTGSSSASASAAVSEAVAVQGSGQVSASASGTLASGSLTGSGDARVSASAAISSSAAVTGAGNVGVAGSATVGQGRELAGTGASAVSASAAFSFGQLGAASSAVSASGTITEAVALLGTGQVSVNGAASFAGATPSGGLGERQATADRRWLATVEARRKLRR